MGGGNLNVHKDWHVSTYANKKAVADAEREAEDEKRKIELIKKGIHEKKAQEDIDAAQTKAGLTVKKSNRIDWMYEGQERAKSSKKEAYMLGKPIEETQASKEAVTAMKAGGLFVEPEAKKKKAAAAMRAKGTGFSKSDPLAAMKALMGR